MKIDRARIEGVSRAHSPMIHLIPRASLSLFLPDISKFHLKRQRERRVARTVLFLGLGEAGGKFI